jgi:V-type ATPase, D subunit
MNINTFPTKGNLINAKNSLKLAKLGFGLMDKKRNILIRELMGLIDKAKTIQSEIDSTYTKAYKALQYANIELGVDHVNDISMSIPADNNILIKSRSVMGTEIPLVEHKSSKPKLHYAYYSTSEALDIAKEQFEKVKELTIDLSMIENSAYRLATSIKKTQKRANALKNITIPMYDTLCKNISNALEEKEREEFTRLKVIKRRAVG